MDNDRFDRLTKGLALMTSRRSVAKTIAGVLVGGGALAASRSPAGAIICRQGGVLCTKDAMCCSGSCGEDHRCACPEGEDFCGGRTCIDLGTDPDNCGSCGHACPAGVSCATCGDTTGCLTPATCDGPDDCTDGMSCINGGCFRTGVGNVDCSNSCTSGCTAIGYVDDPSNAGCFDQNTGVGPCATDVDCPSGTLCSHFTSGILEKPWLCTYPCQFAVA